MNLKLKSDFLPLQTLKSELKRHITLIKEKKSQQQILFLVFEALFSKNINELDSFLTSNISKEANEKYEKVIYQIMNETIPNYIQNLKSLDNTEDVILVFSLIIIISDFDFEKISDSALMLLLTLLKQEIFNISHKKINYLSELLSVMLTKSIEIFEKCPNSPFPEEIKRDKRNDKLPKKEVNFTEVMLDIMIKSNGLLKMTNASELFEIFFKFLVITNANLIKEYMKKGTLKLIETNIKFSKIISLLEKLVEMEAVQFEAIMDIMRDLICFYVLNFLAKFEINQTQTFSLSSIRKSNELMKKTVKLKNFIKLILSFY